MEERATVELGIAGLSRAVHIGTGGSAQVYAATMEKTGETVAVKLLRAATDSEKARKRFDRERQILKRLSAQGGIVPILGSGSRIGANRIS